MYICRDKSREVNPPHRGTKPKQMVINHDQMLGERTASSRLIKTIPAILYQDGEFVCTTSDGIEANVSLAGHYRSGYADQDGRHENDIPVFKKIDYGNLVEYHTHFVGGIKEAYYEIYETPYVDTLISKLEGNPQYFKTALLVLTPVIFRGHKTTK